MKTIPIAAALAAAMVSSTAAADGGQQEQAQTEGHTDSGAVISSERTAEPKSESPEE